MGNVHAFNHRVTAMSMACLSSAGLIFFALSGLSCDYLTLNAEPERSVMTPAGQEFLGESLASIGVRCDSPFYRDDDRMWNLSQIFLYISLGLAAATTLLAWALSTCVAPREFSWRILSTLSACTAVLGVPIFLIFESTPCTMDINRQTCSLDMGGYFNIASVGLFIAMTLWTQCLNPPNWSKETKAFRTDERGIHVNEITIPGGGGTDNGTYEDDDSSPRSPGREFDNASEVSSISEMDVVLRAPKQTQDVEAGSPAHHPEPEDLQQPPEVDRSRSILDTPDSNIRKGAAVVINAIKDRQPSMRRSRKDQRSRSSASAAPSQSDTQGTARILCPDNGKGPLPFSLPDCTGGQQLLEDAQKTFHETAELVRTASKLATGSPDESKEVLITHKIENELPAVPLDRRKQSLQQSVGTPIDAVTIAPDGQYGFDGISEMTPAVSVRTEDVFSILEDLKRLE